MWCGTRKPCSLKVRCYLEHLIDLNKYLDLFPGATLSGKICVTELDKFLLKSMPNSWYSQAYGQGFNCESILLKRAFIMFEQMYIAESIYEGVVEPSLKTPTRVYAYRAGYSR